MVKLVPGQVSLHKNVLLWLYLEITKLIACYQGNTRDNMSHLSSSGYYG